MTLPNFNLAAMGISGYLLIVACIAVSILWLVMPIFVIVIKKRLDEMVNLQIELINIMRQDVHHK